MAAAPSGSNEAGMAKQRKVSPEILSAPRMFCVPRLHRLRRHFGLQWEVIYFNFVLHDLMAATNSVYSFLSGWVGL